jgi:hypothetical protein
VTLDFLELLMCRTCVVVCRSDAEPRRIYVAIHVLGWSPPGLENRHRKMEIKSQRAEVRETMWK